MVKKQPHPALAFHCPECKAAPGEKCKSLYGVKKGRAIAPHKGRGGALSFAPAAAARNNAARKAFEKAEAEAPLFAGLEKPPEKVTAQDEYQRWRNVGAGADGVVTRNDQGYYSADAESLLVSLHVNALRHLARRHLPEQMCAWLLERSLIYPESYRVGFWEGVLTGTKKIVAHYERISKGWSPMYHDNGEPWTYGHNPDPKVDAYFGRIVYIERVELKETYWPPEGWQAPYTAEELKAMFAWEKEPPAEVSDGGLDARLSQLFALNQGE